MNREKIDIIVKISMNFTHIVEDATRKEKGLLTFLPLRQYINVSMSTCE